MSTGAGDRQLVFRHHPMMGTDVEVRVVGAGAGVARAADAAVVAEIERLERVLSAYDPASELRRWVRGEVATPGPDLTAVLRLALDLQLRAGGAFNPLAGVVVRRWREAERQQRIPSAEEVATLAASISAPRFTVDGARVVRTGDLDGLELNAVAKGWIVDRSVDAAARAAPGATVLVAAGGDIAHRGPVPLPVAVEDPLRHHDNAPALAEVVVDGCGVATSGRARRGVRICGRWFSHVVDPRTGWPVDHVASATVVARDAAAADGFATVLGVLPAVAAATVTHAEVLAWMTVGADGAVRTGGAWAELTARRRR